MDRSGSILGFGAMRLPVANGEPGNIDEPQVRRMVMYAVEYADRCTACARCLDLCPHKIDIPSFLTKAHTFLSSETK